MLHAVRGFRFVVPGFQIFSVVIFLKAEYHAFIAPSTVILNDRSVLFHIFSTFHLLKRIDCIR